MALEKKTNDLDFFDKKEVLEREVRENILFKDFSGRLEKLKSHSKGWNKILMNSETSKIKCRSDLSRLPITKKSSLLNLQKNNFPYGNLNTKPYHDFPYMLSFPQEAFPGQSCARCIRIEIHRNSE